MGKFRFTSAIITIVFLFVSFVPFVSQPVAAIDGGDPDVPDIDVSPTFINFGSVSVNSTSSNWTGVFNVGTANLTITDNVSLTGPNADQFLITSDNVSGRTIAPSNSAWLVVAFSPTYGGNMTATLVISSNDPDEPTANVTLTGYGVGPAFEPDIDVWPTSIDFGSVSVNSTSENRTLTVLNVGTANLTISDPLFFTGPNLDEFMIVSGNCSGQTLEPGDNVTMLLAFMPSSSGNKTATLSIPSNDPDEPTANVTLSGFGVALIPDIYVTPTFIDFGWVSVNSTSANWTVFVSNIGTDNLTITDNVSIIGPNADQFLIVSDNVSFRTLAPSENATAQVVFSPTSSGNKTAALSIPSNDPDEPTANVTLTGFGVTLVPDIDVWPTSIDFGSVSVNSTSANQTVTVSNVGSANLTISDNVSISGPNADQFLITSDNCSGSTLAPGKNATLQVAFSPTSSGNQTATLSIPSNDPDENPFKVPLTGFGVTVGVLTVTNTNDSGSGSLRQAILNANANNGTDTISFNITGTGPHTIQPLSALPTITDPVVIDGYTQTGSSHNTNGPGLGINAVLKIELDGSNAGSGVSGLRITAGNSTVRGLVINRFSGNGIFLETNGGNVIEGNFIGTNVTGTADLGNDESGVLIEGVANNTVGGNTNGARNVISGNNQGIRIQHANATGNLVQGNFIGTDVTGTANLGNVSNGVLIWIKASNNTIGGATSDARNVISANELAGVYISSQASGNVVRGNYIGTDLNGTSALGNGTGIVIVDAPNNTVGGTLVGESNLISANVWAGVAIGGTLANGNLVQGNFIGTDVTGTADLGNSGPGVKISSGRGNTIGGTTDRAGNLISGNNGPGVYITGAGLPENLVQGNFIGTDVTGTAALGNSGNGVSIGSYNTAVGGTASGAGNTIAFNGGDGVSVLGTFNNAILANSIFSNMGLGIDLGNDGVTPNDPGDGDTGANNLQNFPVLTSATSGSTTIKGTLNSIANMEFRLEFFSNSAYDPSGHGEGETFLGADNVTTDGSGNVSFTVTFLTTVPVGRSITATATDPNNNTSEFSQGVQVTLVPDIDVWPASIDFGSIPVGSTSANRTVIVSSVGSANLTISDNVSVTGPNADQFIIVSDNVSFRTLAPSENATVQVAFGPTSSGNKTATLSILSNDPDEPTANITLTGFGVILVTEVWVDDDWTGSNPGEPVDGHIFGIDAFARIQDGINEVTSPGIVHVAEGTYVEIITLKDGLQLLGAGANVTTVDGSQAIGYYRSVVTAINVGSSTVLDGFTITGGKGTFVRQEGVVGGGMFNWDSSPTVSNCTFSNNSAEYYGGGMYNYRSSPTVTNCTFSNNSAGYYGGGMHNDHFSYSKVTNCTYSNNSARSGGGIANKWYSSTTLTNCILWADSGGEIYGSTNAIYCDIQGGYGGVGNIDAAPLFVDPLTGDYHLQLGSPCIDAGTNEGAPTEDIEGNSRPIDGDRDGVAITDIGAYEYVLVVVEATIDFNPDTLNLKSKGNMVTIYIELPTGYNVGEIDVSSIWLNDTIPALSEPTEIGDYDSDNISDLMIKFDRSTVQGILEPGDEVEITVSGQLTDNIPFEGIDTIKVIPDMPDILVTPSSINFGLVAVGSTSGNWTVTVSNNGTADLIISDNVSVIGPSANQFLIVSDNVSLRTLAPSENTTLELAFGPTATGNQTATISILSNDPYEATANVTLSGFGVALVPDIDVWPTSIDFGSVSVNSTSANWTVWVINYGTANLTFSDNVPIIGPNADQFLIVSDNVSFRTLTPSENSTIELAFSPTSSGNKTATLSIPSNDPDEPAANVTLSGFGVTLVPDIDVWPTSIDFGSVSVNSTSVNWSVWVNNYGTANLTISDNVSITGPNADQFLITSDNCSGRTLLPSDNATLQVAFSPTYGGNMTATLSIPSNDPDESPFYIPLTGFGFVTANISINAYIDGRSLLIIRTNTVQWHHLEYAAPGLCWQLKPVSR